MSASRGVVVLQTTRYLGDFVLTLPLVRVFSARGAPVTLVCDGRFAPIGARVADVLPCDKGGRHAGVRGLARLAKEVGALGADAALCAHLSFRTALVARLSGVPLRVGFRFRGLVNRRVRRDARSEIGNYLALGAPLGVSGDDEPWCPPGAAAALPVERFSLPARYALFAPGTSWRVKRWGGARYGAVARALAARGLAPVVVGAESDEGEAAALLDVCPDAVSLVSRTSPAELSDLVQRARVVVCGDSAPTHLAAGLGVPVVVVLGPTMPDDGFVPRTGTVAALSARLPCAPCGARAERPCPIGTHECMSRVAVSEVVAAAERLAGAR